MIDVFALAANRAIRQIELEEAEFDAAWWRKAAADSEGLSVEEWELKEREQAEYNNSPDRKLEAAIEYDRIQDNKVALAKFIQYNKPLVGFWNWVLALGTVSVITLFAFALLTAAVQSIG